MRLVRLLCALAVLAAPGWSSGGQAYAAGSAYQVDTSEVSEAGNCKVDSWASWAGNGDRLAAVTPSCALNVGRPLEVSAQFSRTLTDEEWATAVAPKLKLNLVPSEIGRFGLAVSASGSFDVSNLGHTGVAIAVPATLRLSDTVRVNLNAGWFWDRTADRHFLSYGAGVDLRTRDNVWTLTAELFGIAGPAPDQPTAVDPRWQIGLRYRPIDRWNIDLVYGRNLGGENANWVTVATTLRFPADKGEAKKRD